MKNYILLLITISFLSCNNPNSRYEVNQSVLKLSESLKSDKEADFRELIANRTATMPADLHYDILHRLYEQSKLRERTDQLELIDENNHMGQTVYRLPYFQGVDSLTGITNINLILYFGPEDLFPKNKFSDFETEITYDKDLRRQILEEKLNVDLK